ncbi:DUF2934 domain-containing protein [Bradyrhizobium sp. Tv2a-2]|uniref:DUF2934 domain-containing protein n=1 Tax=Bradyrhizobium sp. Tv2a-2 TaxID=113395 RepID=UPI0003F5CA5B|nr:DUF2934 domain-containing protein [Bradyrhizobium sp. Tv2a-2]
MAYPSDDQIKVRAHQLWERAGKPEGRDDEFWRQAEREFEEMDEVDKQEPPAVLPG